MSEGVSLSCLLSTVGDWPNLIRQYLPKKETFGNWRASAISLMGIWENFSRCRMSVWTYSFIQSKAVLPLICLQTVERYLGVTQS